LFLETKRIITYYLIEVSKIHNFNYLAEIEPFERLPSGIVCDGKIEVIGGNMLGKLWMELRKEN